MATEIAPAATVDTPDVSRTTRWRRWRSTMVEANLGSWTNQRVMLEKIQQPLPPTWEEQRSARGEAFPRPQR
jgi:hypothetical protein